MLLLDEEVDDEDIEEDEFDKELVAELDEDDELMLLELEIDELVLVVGGGVEVELEVVEVAVEDFTERAA